MNLIKVRAATGRSRHTVALDAFLALVLSVSVSLVGFAQYAAGEAVTITTTIQAALTFTTSTDNFGNLTPGTPKFATTTLFVTTNSATGWNVSLYGDDVTATEPAMDLDTNAAINITDLSPQWIPGSATTTPGNAQTITNGQDVLAFRVMSASGTESFLSTAWWGTDDTPFTNAKWAGFASSSAANTKIGETSVTSGGTTAINTVQYYLDVPVTQTVGNYSAPLTYTAVVNP